MQLSDGRLYFRKLGTRTEVLRKVKPINKDKRNDAKRGAIGWTHLFSAIPSAQFRPDAGLPHFWFSSFTPVPIYLQATNTGALILLTTFLRSATLVLNFFRVKRLHHITCSLARFRSQGTSDGLCTKTLFAHLSNLLTYTYRNHTYLLLFSDARQRIRARPSFSRILNHACSYRH